MGIRARIAATVIVLSSSYVMASTVEAATRARPPMPSASSHASSGTPSLGSGGTLKVNGPLSGQWIPYDGHGTGPKTKIPVSADYYYSIPRTFNHVKGMFRANLPAVVMGGAVAGIGYGLDWLFHEDQWKVSKKVPAEVDPNGIYWAWGPVSKGNTPYPTAEALCQKRAETYSHSGWRNTGEHYVKYLSANIAVCYVEQERLSDNFVSAAHAGQFNRYGTECPAGSLYDEELRACAENKLVPLTEADISDISPNGFDASYLQSILNNACNGSSNPSGCIEDLLDQTQLSGPASITTPGPTTTTTTTTNGVPSTSTSTTTTTYNFNYGPNYYDYSTTKRTITTGPAGDTTITEESDTQPDGEEPATEITPDDPPAEENHTYTDTEFPPVEPFYVHKYPEGFQGAWNARVVEFQQTEFMDFLQGFVPTFSGSCPEFSLNLNIMQGAMFGMQNFASLCYVFDFIKAILMVTALFTARALIFGG